VGSTRGIQGAGIANYSGGKFKGLQASGIVNYAQGIQGAQMGLVNIIGSNETKGSPGKQKTLGAQFGLVNISGSENIIPIGMVNIIKNGILHPAVYVDDMLITNFSFRSGSKNFYIIMSGGTDFGSSRADENRDWLVSTRAGFGFEFPIKKFFIYIYAVTGNMFRHNNDDRYNTDEINDYYSWNEASFINSNTTVFQLRLSAGYKLFEHFGIFGGVSYDYFYRHNDNSPIPMSFGEFLPGSTQGKNIHKVGLFGGIQF
jgi:hypothetical protein